MAGDDAADPGLPTPADTQCKAITRNGEQCTRKIWLWGLCKRHLPAGPLRGWRSAIRGGSLIVASLGLAITLKSVHDWFEPSARRVAGEQKHSEPSGFITPANEPNPSFVPKDVKPDDVVVCTGTSCGVYSMFGESPILTLANFGSAISIKRTDKGAMISATVFNSNGIEYATIVDNQLTLNTYAFFRRGDRDPHELVLEDKDERRVLSVRFVNDRTYVVEGQLFYPGIGTIDLDKLPWAGRNAGLVVLGHDPQSPPDGLFKPGYLGYRRVNPNYSQGTYMSLGLPPDGTSQFRLHFLKYEIGGAVPELRFGIAIGPANQPPNEKKVVSTLLRRGDGLAAIFGDLRVEILVEQDAVGFPLVGIVWRPNSPTATELTTFPLQVKDLSPPGVAAQ